LWSVISNDMATKQELKVSEARILIYLSQALPQARYLMGISFKLEIDYNYLSRIMQGLRSRGLVRRASSLIKNKSFYDITELGISRLEQAAAVLSGPPPEPEAPQ